MNLDEVKRERVSNLVYFWFMFNVEPFLNSEIFEDFSHNTCYQNHLIYYLSMKIILEAKFFVILKVQSE